MSYRILRIKIACVHRERYQRCPGSVTSVIERIDTFSVIGKLLVLQPRFIGLFETAPLSQLRGTLRSIDRRGIGVCTPLEKDLAADAGSGDRRHIPTWNGNAAKWEAFRDEIRVWRLGENLNVKYSLAARLVSGLSGPARLTCMTMDAEQLHPPHGEGPVGNTDERRNIAGLDNVMNVWHLSPGLCDTMNSWAS